MNRAPGDNTTRLTLTENVPTTGNTELIAGANPQLYVYVKHWMKGTNIAENPEEHEGKIRQLVCHTLKTKQPWNLFLQDAEGSDRWYTEGLWRPDVNPTQHFHLDRTSGFSNHLFTTVILCGDGSNDENAIRDAVKKEYDSFRNSAVVVWKVPLCTSSTPESPVPPPATVSRSDEPLKVGTDLVFYLGSPPAFMCLGIFKRNADGIKHRISYPKTCVDGDHKLLSGVKILDNSLPDDTPCLSDIYKPSNWACE